MNQDVPPRRNRGRLYTFDSVAGKVYALAVVRHVSPHLVNAGRHAGKVTLYVPASLQPQRSR
ncbi:MAG: hypothetical protein IPG22_17000 [Acidobacteria bacterium]|nr:hypothetical protein [Acidobacteriota bacterium]